MNRFFTLSLCFLALSLSVYGQVPDYIPTEGLVSWYPLDNNAYDYSLNENHGVIQNVNFVNNRFGYPNSAAHFDGVSSHINISLSSISNELTSTTINLWIKTSDANAPLFSCQGPGGYELSLNIGTLADILVQSDLIGVFIRDVCCGTGNNGFGSYLTDNNWHMVSLVRYLNGSVKLYIDGGLDFELSPSNGGTLIFDASTMALGAQLNWISGGTGCGSCNSTDEQRLEGVLDDVSIWDIPLTSDQIEALYLDEGLNHLGCIDYTACNFNEDAVEDDGSCDYTCCPGPGCCSEGMYWDWDLQECFNTTPTDTNFDGCTDLNDLMDILANYGDCAMVETNYSLNFDGVDDYVDMGNTSSLKLVSDITIAVEIMIDSSQPHWQHILSYGGYGEEQIDNMIYLIEIPENSMTINFLHEYNGGNNVIIPSNYEFSPNQWYNLVVTRDVTNQVIDFYIDGILVQTSPFSISPNGGSNGHFSIGNQHNAPADFFKGNLDNVAVWNTVLTQEQIQSYMSIPPIGNEEGLVSYWDFNEGTGSTLTDQTSNGNDGVINGATWSTDVPTAP